MELKRGIGKKALLFITINAILGTGIFFLPAVGAIYSGSSSIIAWIAMSVVAVFTSMYFAELVAMFPRSGGIYEYIKKSFGELPSFILGWTAWIVANITIAMLVVGALLYLFPASSFIFHLGLSLAIILLFNYISYRGIDFSTKLLLFFGLMTVITLLALIIPGLPSIDFGRFDPIYVSAPVLLLTIYFIAETFFGWETTTYLAEEIKDAEKVLPKFIITATVIIAVLSILLVLVSLGSIDAETFSQQEAPMNFLASFLFGGEFASLFAVIVFIPLVGTAATWIVSSPRLLFAMARDRVLVPRLALIHEKYRTPHYAILLQTIVTSFVAVVALASYRILLSLLVPLVLILYSVVMLSLVKLRLSKPQLSRPFRAPFGFSGPILIVLFNFILLLVWLEQVPGAIFILLMSVILVSFGLPLYLLIKLQVDQRFVEKFFDRSSCIWENLFCIWYGNAEINKVVEKLEIKNNHNVLDFGCGTGLTTIELARRAVNGRVVAVDISEQQIKKAEKRIRKASNLSNVIFIKEKELAPFEKNSFDSLTAVGVLDHLMDPEQMLKKLFRFLKPGGRFSFLSFGSSLGIPAAEFMKRKNIEALFKKLGVKAKINIEKRKMTEYIYIWGRK